jgi:hypothetical protein
MPCVNLCGESWVHGARSLVFDVPDQIRGQGRLVRTSDGDWFGPPLAVPLAWNRTAPTPWRYAIPIEGANSDTVKHRHEHDGAVEGNATIYGRWLGDRIRVHRQTAELPEPAVPRWSAPPCPAPSGGWPLSREADVPENLDVDLGDLEATGAAVTVVIFRPSTSQAVLVVAGSDIAAVEAQLHPQLPDRLCVVASRWTRRQLDGAHEHLRPGGSSGASTRPARPVTSRPRPR